MPGGQSLKAIERLSSKAIPDIPGWIGTYESLPRYHRFNTVRSFGACSTPSHWLQYIPWPPCWPGQPGDDDTNTEPDNPTTDDANSNE